MKHSNKVEGAQGFNNRKIDIKAARKILGMIGSNYTDEELTEIIDVLYGIAEESFETYQKSQKDK